MVNNKEKDGNHEEGFITRDRKEKKQTEKGRRVVLFALTRSCRFTMEGVRFVVENAVRCKVGGGVKAGNHPRQLPLRQAA